MVQRGGRVVAKVVPDAQQITLMPRVQKRILPEAVVYTDESGGYNPMAKSGYHHRRIHHAAGVYVAGTVHTNTIEDFWSLVKRGISGVGHAVSAKYLQGYLDGYLWRDNHRHDDRPMFKSLLENVPVDRALVGGGSPS